MIKAVFFDVDGTLRGFRERGISESTGQALEEARAAGMKLFVATGRHRLEMEEEGLLGDLEFDGYVTLNGQYCYGGRGLIYHNPIDPKQVRRACALLEEEPFPCLFIEEDAMYINLVDDLVRRAQKGVATAIPPVMDVRRALSHPVYQMVVYVEPDRGARIMEALDGCAMTMWNEYDAYDITPAGGDKSAGVSRMIQSFGIAREETAAVGDGKNDVSMLTYAGLGIAMGNGCDEAKAAADFVTGGVDEGGLLKAVRHLIEYNRRNQNE